VLVTTHIALLRGVNVGGHRKLPMSDLRAICTDAGYGDVATYIQSGNVVFTSQASAATVQRELGRHIARATGLDVDVVVRTKAELAKVVRSNPFLGNKTDASHLHVVFLQTMLPRNALSSFDADAFAPEAMAAKGREVYLLMPNGLGRAKLPIALGKTIASLVATTRNWKTVTTLLTMAEQV
jgi:uncharacterized protein (DUF1697 family)